MVVEKCGFKLTEFSKNFLNKPEESESYLFHWQQTSFKRQVRLNSPAIDHTSTS